MLRYLTAGESHGPALTAIVEGFPSGVDARRRIHQRRTEAPARRLRPRQAPDARDRPSHRRFGHLPRRHHRRTDHPPSDQQRRQARTPRRARRASRGAHRPCRLDQLSDRHPPGPRTRQRPRDGACGSRSARWPSFCFVSWGSRFSATSASSAGSSAPPLSLDLAVRDASPVYTLEPRGRPQDRRGDRRRQSRGRHTWRGASRRS